jgi:hypothetical protein
MTPPDQPEGLLQKEVKMMKLEKLIAERRQRSASPLPILDDVAWGRWTNREAPAKAK